MCSSLQPKPDAGKTRPRPGVAGSRDGTERRQGVQLLMTTGMAESQPIVEFEAQEPNPGLLSG
ncbi:MAG: hypothetical protein ACI8VE_003041 [Natrialbaceae archaeon]|jgi:hypothetical protein